MATDNPNARVIKRSLVIAGHRTSVSLEDAFWRRLRRIAAERGLSLNGLAAMVDASRGGANLSSAIRVFVLEAEAPENRPPAAVDSRSVELAWRRVDLRRARLRPGRGPRGCGAGLAPTSSLLGAGAAANGAFGVFPARLPSLGLDALSAAPFSLCHFPRRGFRRCSSSPRRPRRLSPLPRASASARLALQPRLFDFPVLDLLLPSIHEPLALETPIEEGALADIGFHRGDAIGLSRDRLGGERRGKGADVDLPLRRLQSIVDRHRRARRGPDQNFKSLADEVSVKARLCR